MNLLNNNIQLLRLNDDIELLRLNNDIECSNPVCQLKTKYGISNVHKLIITNRIYLEKIKNNLKMCIPCEDNFFKFLDNGLNCTDCVKVHYNIAKTEKQYGELIYKYIVDLETLK